MVGLGACAVSLFGACGGGSGGAGAGSSSASTTTPAPGANVDPNSTGYIGGPVNKAKAVANQSEQHDAQVEQQGTAGEP